MLRAPPRLFVFFASGLVLACSTYGSLDLPATSSEVEQAGSSAGGRAGNGSVDAAGSDEGPGGAGTGGAGASGGVMNLSGSGGTGGSPTAGGGSGGSATTTVTPSGVTFAEQTSDVVHELNADSTPFSERCPDGQVLIGFHGTVDAPGGKSYLRSAQGICGIVNVSSSEPYAVTVTEADPLPMHEIASAQEQTALCPKDQVMIGFAGRSGLWMDSVDVRCAPLTILGVSPKFLLVVGTAATAGTIGGPTGGSPFDPAECAAGDIAVGQIIRTIYAGAVLGAFGVQCAKASLTLTPN